MPQKPLKVAKKIQKPTGNRHGKKPTMKKGEQLSHGQTAPGMMSKCGPVANGTTVTACINTDVP